MGVWQTPVSGVTVCRFVHLSPQRNCEKQFSTIEASFRWCVKYSGTWLVYPPTVDWRQRLCVCLCETEVEQYRPAGILPNLLITNLPLSEAHKPKPKKYCSSTLGYGKPKLLSFHLSSPSLSITRKERPASPRKWCWCYLKIGQEISVT